MPPVETEMEKFDLIEAVQPQDGYYCVFGVKDDGFPKQYLYELREEFDNKVKELLDAKYNVFYAVAKFKTGDNRKKSNVQGLKALWLDLDCAPGKDVVNEKTGRPDGYASKKEAKKALAEFCQTVGLPAPTIVNSGRGYHVYWILEEVVTAEEWEPVAYRLRDVCNTQELYVDNNVFDVARVLRVPDTLNFKQDPPLPVAVQLVSDPVKLATIKEILGVEDLAISQPKGKRRDSLLGQRMRGNIEYSFTKIMIKSSKGKGCAQLLDCYNNQATISEPRWFNALSVASKCKDWEKAIHRISEKHPDYDYAATERKIQHIQDSHSCEQFEQNNPGGCEGCPHKGKIKKPIELGKDVATSVTIVEPSEIGELARQPLDSVDRTKLPPPPAGYTMGANGGVYVDTGEEIKAVYENDLYLINILEDPDIGDVLVLRVHLPKDGVREIVVPFSKFVDKAEFKRKLAEKGVIGGAGQDNLMYSYVLASVKELQEQRSADKMSSQFGWLDNDTKFLVGTREITADNVYHRTPSSATEPLVPMLEPVGTLDKWKEVWALYGREGMEVQAFAALTGFASPLLKFTGQKGVIVSLVHKFAGTGKTTVLRMANSVFGNPSGLLGIEDDTYNGKILKTGLLNNLCNTIDELTNIEDKKLSSLVYALSQGKGKDKSETHTNRLRFNNVTWNSMTLTSSNKSNYQTLSNLKNAPDGEYMRMLEFKVEYTGDVISKDEGRMYFDHQLQNNYGHAIVPFIQEVLSDFEEAKTLLLNTQRRIDAELKLTQRERNWSAGLAAIVTAGLIAKRIGLLEGWDINHMYQKVVPKILEMREVTTAPVGNTVGVIGDYLNRKYARNTLVINKYVDKRSNMPSYPIREPSAELEVRIEPDAQLIYLAAAPFKSYCLSYQEDYTDLTGELKTKGIYKKAKPVRLGTGWSTGTPVHCIILDASNSEFLNIENLTGSATENEDRERSVSDKLEEV